MRTTKQVMAMGLGLLLLGTLAARASTNTVANGTPGIKGSYHDFSYDTWNATLTPSYKAHTLCTVCHEMHNSDPSKLIPLWGHQTSISAGSFQLYQSPTIGYTPSQPSGATLACLSCHDGVTAINSYGGTTNGAAVFMTNSLTILGTDLSLNHPVSFSYTTAQANDPYLRSPSDTADSTNRTGVAAFSGVSLNKAMLGNNGRMECSSCHDIHRQRGRSMYSGVYVVNSAAYGDLCLMCHIK